MTNIPELKLGIISVSRSCFPITLSAPLARACTSAQSASRTTLTHARRLTMWLHTA